MYHYKNIGVIVFFLTNGKLVNIYQLNKDLKTSNLYQLIPEHQTKSILYSSVWGKIIKTQLSTKGRSNQPKLKVFSVWPLVSDLESKYVQSL